MAKNDKICVIFGSRLFVGTLAGLKRATGCKNLTLEALKPFNINSYRPNPDRFPK